MAVETETNGVVENAGRIDAITTDATAGTIDSNVRLVPYANGTAVTDAFVVESTGNVGLGTADPTRTLDVRGQAYISSSDPYAFSIHTNDVNADILFHANGSIAAEGQINFNMDADNDSANSNITFGRNAYGDAAR